MMIRIGGIEMEHSLTTFGVSPSGPGAFCAFRFLRSFQHLAGTVTFIDDIVGKSSGKLKLGYYCSLH